MGGPQFQRVTNQQRGGRAGVLVQQQRLDLCPTQRIMTVRYPLVPSAAQDDHRQWPTLADMTAVIAFDVNETLLDLSALDASFEEVLGSAALRGQWFAQMLQLSFVGGLSGEYVDFSTAQHAALLMIAERNARTITRPRQPRWSTR
jgi:hypothetical protein